MNIALILSGGVGTRMGTDVPKQYIEVKGKPIIAYTMEKFELHELIDKIHIVAEPQWHDYILEYAKVKPIGFSKPGYNRQLSILNGLEDILKVALPDDNIIIHDAVRPLSDYYKYYKRT